MAVDGFDFTELEEFNTELVRLAQVQFPKETKAFLRREANKVNRIARKGYKSETKKKTGNLLKGLTRGKPYIYNGEEYQIRAKNKARHAHLIEFGHINVKNGGFVVGKHIMDKAGNEFKPTFLQDAEVYIDDLLEKGLH